MFGRRAGLAAADYATRQASFPAVNAAEIEAESRTLLAPFELTSGESPYEVHRALQDCMQALVGIYRVEADIAQALVTLGQLKARAALVRVEGTRMYNPGWHLARDLRNMLVVSEAIARSALLRRESRGAHSRLDFTGMDAALGQVNHCVKMTAGALDVRPTPLPEMPAELRALFEEPAKQGSR